ncbi:hypothetical protein B0J14DRAFT_565224 [Halenospora varia]|nr:hypothetical protein B0J14DRAFT_565224 [Halenospora varia]
MDVVVCYCQKCNLELAQFKNSWNGIGKAYSSPVYPMLPPVNGFEAVGPVFPGSPGSSIESSFLQDLVCRRCRTSVGLRCDSAPQGHMLSRFCSSRSLANQQQLTINRDQLILALPKMNVISDATGDPAKISTLQNFSLTLDGPGKPSVSRRAATVQPAAARKSMSMAPPTNGESAANGSILPPTNQPSFDLSSFKSWTQDSINTQQKDIDRVSGALNRIEVEMQVFREFIKETRMELKKNEQFQISQDVDRNAVGQIKTEVEELAQKVHDLGQQGEQRGMSGVSLSKDIEIIISDMVKVYDKAYEVEDVKEDLRDVKNQLRVAHDVATQNSADLRANNIAETEVNDLRDEVKELKTRLKFVEHAVQTALPAYSGGGSSQQSLNQSEKRVPRVEILVSDGEATWPRRNSHSLRSPATVSKKHFSAAGIRADESFQPLKRKHQDTEDTPLIAQGGDTSEASLPIKKRKVSGVEVARPSSRQDNTRLKAPRREVIEILSSEHGGSPDLDAPKEANKLNNTKIRNNLASKVALNDTDPSRTNLPERRTRRASLRRVVSINGLTTSAATEPEAFPVPKPRRRQSDAFDARRRDSNGLLLTPAGKVDGRSLRRLKNLVANGEDNGSLGSYVNEPAKSLFPTSVSTKPLSSSNSQPTKLSNSNGVRTSGKSTEHETVLPSIERDEDEIEAQPQQSKAPPAYPFPDSLPATSLSTKQPESKTTRISSAVATENMQPQRASSM